MDAPKSPKPKVYTCLAFPAAGCILNFSIVYPLTAKPTLEVNQEELLTLFVALNEPVLCPRGLNDAI